MERAIFNTIHVDVIFINISHVNDKMTKVMWCRLSKGQAEDSGEIHVVFAGRELVTTQTFVWSVIDGFTRDVVAFQES